MRVSPAVYDAVAAARPGEFARDCPLMLLGLPLVADAASGRPAAHARGMSTRSAISPSLFPSSARTRRLYWHGTRTGP